MTQSELNIKVLTDTFGEDTVILETKEASGFRVSLNNAQISEFKAYSWMRFRLAGQIKYASSFTRVNANKIVYLKEGNYTFRNLGLGRLPYTTTITVENIDGVFTCSIQDGRDKIAVENFLYDSVNAPKLEEVKSLFPNYSEEQLVNHLTTKVYTYDYDIPEIIKDELSSSFEVEILEQGLVKVRTVILKNGKELEEDEQPYKHTYFPTNYEGEQIGDAFVGGETVTICNDYRKREYDTLRGSKIKLKCISQFKESDGDIINLPTERNLTEFEENSIDFNYFNLGVSIAEDYIIPTWNNTFNVEVDPEDTYLDSLHYVKSTSVEFSDIKEECVVEWYLGEVKIKESSHNKNGLRVSDIFDNGGCKGVFPLTCKIEYRGQVFKRTLNTNIQINTDVPSCENGLTLSDMPNIQELYPWAFKR